jgi:hypothetical protein
MPVSGLSEPEGARDVSEPVKYLGILAGLSDPEVMARYGERQRIAERIARQMGVEPWEGMEALRYFEESMCSDGQTIN